MASSLIAGNEALVQSTIDVLCGRRAQVGFKRPLRGTAGFERIEPEDAMQAGRIAFAKALDQYNPERGKFQWYFCQKAIYELQKVERYGGVHLLHVPENHINSYPRDMALFGAFRDLDSGDEAETTDGGATLKDWTLTTTGDLVEQEDFTPEDVEGWAEKKEWPESLESWRAEKAERAVAEALEPEPEPEDTRTALEKFLDEEVSFSKTSRVAKTPLISRWRWFAFSVAAMGSEPQLRSELRARGVRRTTVRVPWNRLPVEGFAGVRLQNAI